MSPHVRFSSKNSFHSPPPPLAPSTSSSSASSQGPLTPPSIPRMPQLERGLLIPTKSVSHAHLQPPPAPVGRAHNLLAFSTTPLLRYDVSLHPSLISTHFVGVSTAGYMEPAVYPPQSSITLRTPHLPWSIVVEASNTRFVSVSDVLNTIYRSLRVNVRKEEFDMLGGGELMRKVKEMYVRRCEKLWSSGSEWEKERREGVKRIDFLLGFYEFQGISPKEGDPGVWHLTIA
ncbi:hypothetical protein R3P38DRAFT_2661593 [Favolaschia claudopus]|uniref:DUF6699 domain-containing protein n=1 Tax=Favolaschia claudopus TaxID=2862362 RepID=A0AAV9ZM40_9AGAR